MVGVRDRQRQQPSDPGTGRDAGVSLVLAALSGLIAMSLVLVATATVVLANRNSGVDRQRAAAVSSAEAGVDAALAAVQSATSASLPCTIALTTRASDTPVTTVQLKYETATGTPVPCVSGYVPPSEGMSVKRVAITSTATTEALSGGTTKGERAMEALAEIEPLIETGGGLPDAIHASESLNLSKYLEVLGNSGNDANIYGEANVSCDNGGIFQGSIHTKGSIDFSSSCHVSGDIWAQGAVTISSSSASVSGYVRSSAGPVAMVPETTTSMVGRMVESPSINWDGCWTTSSRTTLRDPARCNWVTPPAPPERPFPIIRGDAAARASWVAAGYTLTVINSTSTPVNCDSPDVSGLNGITDWFLKTAPTLTGKNLIVINCAKQLRFQNMTTPITLSGDLAVFTYGGLVTSGPLQVTSDDPSVRRVFHAIVPYDATTTPGACDLPTIAFNNQTRIESSITTLVYSPCDTSIDNEAVLHGQIYGGRKIKINNALSMRYQPVPMPDGAVTLPPDVDAGAGGHSLGLIYKREVQP